MAEMPFSTHTTSGLRGHYDGMASDWTISQNMTAISDADHAMWRALYQRQMPQIQAHAAKEVLNALNTLELSDGIPDFKRLNALLDKATGFQLVAVPGLIPGAVFFDHLAHRRFPATNWIRQPHERDYLVEPDVFHDVFGHLPLLLNPVFADYMALFGQKGPEAAAWDAAHPSAPISASERLSRLYWFTVEFGLIAETAGNKAYGAGILSSYQETDYAINSPLPQRRPFSLQAAMDQAYCIDQLQTTYFVLDDFKPLFASASQSFDAMWAIK